MPKLSTKRAAAVATAELVSGDFPLLPNGWYFARLESVTAEDGNYGSVWVVVLKDFFHAETAAPQTGRQWYRLHQPQEGPAPANYVNGEKKWSQFQAMSDGRTRAFFEAFGYTADSDTEEMINEWTMVKIGTRTIQSGNRKGEVVNDVKELKAVPDDFDPDEFDVADTAEDSAF